MAQIIDSVKHGLEAAAGVFYGVYNVIFPEFPDIGIIIFLITILTIVTELFKTKKPLIALVSGLKIFISLTVLFIFLHLMIKLFFILQNHAL